MIDEIFNQCQEINSLLNESTKDSNMKARDKLIQLLSYHKENNIDFSPLVNHLIRLTGLYPYLEVDNSLWSDRLAYEMFKINGGLEQDVVLHLEQSDVLKKLLNGKNIVVSAPTSFGKSFIIDAFIAIKKPKCILIIVPTIALLNECRRRINSKFSNEYKIITTSNAKLAEKNILILTQERALQYVKILKSVDLLVIDEFYKVSIEHDKERAPILQKLISDISSITKQKYFLAPNINGIDDSALASDIEFVDKLDFNTVFLNINELYKEIKGTAQEKASQKEVAFIKALTKNLNSKSLIYAGTYSELEKVSELIINSIKSTDNVLANQFSNWISINYSEIWAIKDLLIRGFGIHSGQLHRPLAQIQMKLFEEESGLAGLVSTSSVVEGINSSAKNVFIWRDRNGSRRLDYFLYRNIIGRAGRMFKYFVGEVYLLEEPPVQTEVQLSLVYSENSLLSLYNDNYSGSTLTPKQLGRIHSKQNIQSILGSITFEQALESNMFRATNFKSILDIKNSLVTKKVWNGINYLNSDNPDEWVSILFELCKLGSNLGGSYTDSVNFIVNLYKNRNLSIPEQLSILNLSIDDFFKYERQMAFSIPPLAKDIEMIYNLLNKEKVDLSYFYTKVSYAFLPTNIYLLEEYGLPRMISKKIHRSELIDLEDNAIDINEVINRFKNIDITSLLKINLFDDFDKYIIKYFYEGI